MSWVTDLSQTYNALVQRTPRPGEPLLLPVSHTMQNAHVEVLLDEDGNVLDMKTLGWEEAATIVPCTEDSASRSSGLAPHALFDNLKYTAGDLYLYSRDNKHKDAHKTYIKQLKDWCESPYCVEDVRVIYQYLCKKTLTADLISRGILEEQDDKLQKNWNGDKKNKPLDTYSTFIRFKVKHQGMPAVECNENHQLFQAFSQYYSSKKTGKRLCYVEGKETIYADKHPAKIRGNGDNAKLISCNDSTNFTYRGRFRQFQDAVTIGYEATQKAHNALRWLVDNQGWKNGEQTILSWSMQNAKIPPLNLDTQDICGESYNFMEYSPMEDYAKKLKKAFLGYRHGDLQAGLHDKIMIMVLEAATPGRLSIPYYRVLPGSDYLDRVEEWHRTCVWHHQKWKQQGVNGDGKPEYIMQPYMGAPSPNDIVYALYGEHADDKEKKATCQQLVTCITDARQVPRDWIRRLVIRFSNAQSKADGELRKITSVACALIRKYYYDKGVEYTMSLDTACRDRSYLFGRLLAYAERIESYAIYLTSGKDERRAPNALKLRSRFRVQPARTWLLLEDRLQPYITRLYSKHNWLYEDMLNVLAQFSPEDFVDNAPLDERYVLGYASQMAEFLQKKEEVES